MVSALERDAARERWSRKAEALGLPDPRGLRSGELNGLASRFSTPSTRFVVLPGDPFRTDLQFDDELWEWWGQDRHAPFGGSVRWHRSVPSMDAVAHVQGYGDQWETCLALHRHGGVEVISQDFYTLRDGIRALRLVRSVALAWIAFDAQAWVLSHLDVPGPWQILCSFHDTKGSVLGGFAEGWREPHDILASDPAGCREANVLITLEVEQFPTDPDDVQELAFDVGGRIEDAWGVRHRRFLSCRGDAIGEFDARRWDY